MCIHLDCLIARLLCWMSFYDSQKISALNLANNPNEYGYA